MKTQTILYWCARIIAALIMFQTLFFKFSGAEESVKIFSQLNAEAWGRIGSGVLELISSILILIPTTVWLGSALAIGLMGGAIVSHIAVIGVLRDDGGQLFFYAVVVFICALYSFWKSKQQVPDLLRRHLPSFLQ